jgi:EAL domain-containing protein (putative c-di-GMP-specific phosphodiesterase class I)
VAEESDLIVKLGSYVLANAVREAVRWQKELPRPDNPVFVGVNVSSRQLFRPELIKEVRHILGRAVIPKGSLRLEITESLVMENPEKATVVLRQLADAGAGLALDDFGTGYSSLSYLNQFTFDTIKIDGSFLHAGSESGAGSVILRSVVALAHELGKKVVIEGVESEDDVSLLRLIGCEYGQGYFYGEPMSEREALQLLRVVRRAEKRMSRKTSLLRKRPKADEAPARSEDPPAASAPPRPAAPHAAATNNGLTPPPLPQAPTAAEVGAQPVEARPPGPPPLPATSPIADAARLGSLPPTPLRSGAAHQADADGGADHTAPAVPGVSADVSPPPRAGPPPLPPMSGSKVTGPPMSPLARVPPPQPSPQAQPKLGTLPPAIAESLAKLAAGPRGQQ